MPKRYRKKPVVIEAIRLTPDNGKEVWEWADSKPFYAPDGTIDGLSIFTIEGRMKADFGDWIIRGVKGEFYPCKPDIFDATYEPVQ
jgi:hypothetical protein